MRQLREKHNLKGIALTGHGMDTDIQQTRAAGFQAHLTKPVSFDQLMTTIDALMRE
jgi:CheY-like chemotaxis protein